ncbi:MAG: hypothetical protein PHE68_00675 [Candidatus Peribacteraceae bacterium]|nr:hypothetical protein [Candidatus Peribacteraceae bacterium]MDD5075164.1 hypothetical protein [Candidatus Peribacteraceae bacterium]
MTKIHNKPVLFGILGSLALTCVAAGGAEIFRAELTGGCSSTPVASDTMITTYRMRDRADGYGISVLKDGGYLLMGDTVYSSGMGVWNAFLVKTDAKGKALWSKQFGSQSAAQGVLAATKRLSVQTTDGNIVTAHDIIDFYDANYENRKEAWGDVLVTKLNGAGNRVWSTMVGDYSMDFPQKLWAAPDGGVLLLAKFKKTGYGRDIADFDAVPDYSVVVKFDKNGKVQWSKKMNWTATDMTYLADGSFVALADIDTRSETEMAMGAIPTIIKLDGKLNVQWAKSIESLSLELPMTTGSTPGKLKMSKAKIRMGAGEFRSVEQTQDGGFIAFGRYFNATSIMTDKTGTAIRNLVGSVPYIAVKVNAGGGFQWAKRVTTGFTATDVYFSTAKTGDNGFVLARTVMRKSGMKKLTDMTGNLELLKTDADFNPRWTKKIDIERDTSGSDLRATRDGGVAVTGRIVTTEEHLVMGSMEPYEEAILIKADVNGAVSGAKVVSDGAKVAAEDQSSLITMQTMSVSTGDMKLPVNKAVKEKISKIENLARVIVPFATTKVTAACSTGTSGKSKSSAAGTGAPAATGTWAQINYDSAKEARIETEKSRQIHEELLPILKKLFDNRVKMTDNTSGLWLTYLFPRPATRADVEAVRKAYEKLGYKIDESEGGRLNVSRIGRSLRMTFSINNSMVGKLEVML